MVNLFFEILWEFETSFVVLLDYALLPLPKEFMARLSHFITRRFSDWFWNVVFSKDYPNAFEGGWF